MTRSPCTQSCSTCHLTSAISFTPGHVIRLLAGATSTSCEADRQLLQPFISRHQPNMAGTKDPGAGAWHISNPLLTTSDLQNLHHIFLDFKRKERVKSLRKHGQELQQGCAEVICEALADVDLHRLQRVAASAFRVGFVARTCILRAIK